MNSFLVGGKRWFEGFHNRLVSNRIGSAVESRFPESTMKMFKKPELSGLILLLLCEKLELEGIELPSWVQGR